MKCLLRLALLAGLALAGGAAPAFAQGAFGLFYERCTGCCAGCPKPWNAFSDGPAPRNWYGQTNGCAQMPPYPYQGPGDSDAGGYACGDPNQGCGMGGPPPEHWLTHKLHALFGHGHHNKYNDDDVGIGFEGGHDAGHDGGPVPGSCGPNGCAPAWMNQHGGSPAGYGGHYPTGHVPVQYAPQYPGYGYPAPAYPHWPAGR
jgi:hypothetical protein